MVKTLISKKDLELIALREVRSFPGGEFVMDVEVEPPVEDWTLHAIARGGADREGIQYAIRTTTRKLKNRYSLR